jgi:hypothetical protein
MMKVTGTVAGLTVVLVLVLEELLRMPAELMLEQVLQLFV